jgi:hypothetical protein
MPTLGLLLSQASIAAKLGLLIGVSPLVLGVLYALRPNERRLALMRPISLAAIFSALCTVLIGVVNVLTGLAATPSLTLASVQRALPGLAESVIPMFLTFACLTVAWLCVALGLRRQA